MPTNRVVRVPSLRRIDATRAQAAKVECERLLLREGNRVRIEMSGAWARQFPADAGVYAVFNRSKLVYVGESGSLRGRMNDLRNTLNHVLRRSIGKALFSGLAGFRPATARRHFPPHIEALITKYMGARLSVAAVAVPFGRSEVEEHMTGKHRPRYNSKGKRGTRLHANDNGKGAGNNGR